MLVQHELEILRLGFRDRAPSGPAADEMDQGVDAPEFGRGRLGRRMNRLPIAQIRHARKRTRLGQVQVPQQGIQFALIVIQQDEGCPAFGKGLGDQAPESAGCASDDNGLIHNTF